jgi:cytochrome c5
MPANSAAWVAVSLLTAATLAADGVPPPEVDGKKIVETACVSCHGLDVVANKQGNREQWHAVVWDMVGRGASLNTEEAAQAVEYLAKNFGENKGRKLVEDICSLCHVWQRVKGHELTKEQWGGVIKGMIVEGAPVTDEEFNLIVEYLAKNFGPAED